MTEDKELEAEAPVAPEAAPVKAPVAESTPAGSTNDVVDEDDGIDADDEPAGDEGESEEGEGEEDDADLMLEEDLAPLPQRPRQDSRAEAGRRDGWLNQLPDELRREAIEDPRAFAERIRRQTVRENVDPAESVDAAVEQLLEEHPAMSEANKDFFRKFGEKIGRAVRSEQNRTVADQSKMALRQQQIRVGMARLAKRPEWKDMNTQRAFWGEVRMLEARNKWAPPEVIARRIGINLDGGPKKKPAEVVESPAVDMGRRSVALGDVRGSAAGTKPSGATPRPKAKSALEAWLETPVARELDRRAARRG